ncbi:MAG: hypothetical protein M3O09_03530 [Acidobacteriota bacterium]|nr:hypothetical protein [Acidobacteriota bacterium]
MRFAIHGDDIRKNLKKDERIEVILDLTRRIDLLDNLLLGARLSHSYSGKGDGIAPGGKATINGVYFDCSELVFFSFVCEGE